MLLSNISSHPSLTPLIPSLPIPLISISATTQAHFPKFYYPYARSASSTVHPDFRPMMEESRAPVGSQSGVEWERGSVEAIRCLVQAFEEGAAEGVEKGDKDAKRKGSVHFLASVFANVSMVSPLSQRVPFGPQLIFCCAEDPSNPTAPIAPVPHLSEARLPKQRIPGRRAAPDQDCRLHGAPRYHSPRRRLGMHQECRNGQGFTSVLAGD